MATLRSSAGRALAWSAGANLVRDVLQIATMLVLVRLLTPADYGGFALAQAIIGAVAVLSYKTVAPFALQARDPDTFDWHTHFAVGLALNPLALLAVAAVAAGLFAWGGTDMETVALVTAVMGLTFLLDVPATFRMTLLQARHEWARMRLLVLAGALASSVGMILLAWLGAGVYALAAGNLLFVIPFLIDFAGAPEAERPRLSEARLSEWGEGWRFWRNRSADGALLAGSALAERSILARQFGLAPLGIYTRSVGLAQITSGRVAPLAMQTLYPILTRAEAGTERFRHFAGLLMQGILIVAVPAAAFLALEAERIVAVLYGSGWAAVVPLVPLAAAWLTLKSVAEAMNTVMVANLDQARALRLAVVATVLQLAVIVLAAPFGPNVLLAALIAHAAVTIVLYAARAGGALEATPLARSLAGIALASGTGVVATLLAHPLVADMPMGGWHGAAALALLAAVYGLATLLALRLFARALLAEVVTLLPIPTRWRGAVGRIFG